MVWAVPLAAPSMGGLTILKSDPRLYFLDVNGQRLELSTEQLQMPLQFQRACMEQIDFMPPTMKPADWQQLVNNLMSTATAIEVPKELTTTGQFEELLKSFVQAGFVREHQKNYGLVSRGQRTI